MKQKNSATITEDKVTEIFCFGDDFCKVFDAQMAKTESIRFFYAQSKINGKTFGYIRLF